MTEYITLIGADQVATAGRQMMHAADEMQSAARTIDASIDRQRTFLEEFINRFEAAVAAMPRSVHNE